MVNSLEIAPTIPSTAAHHTVETSFRKEAEKERLSSPYTGGSSPSSRRRGSLFIVADIELDRRRCLQPRLRHRQREKASARNRKNRERTEGRVFFVIVLAHLDVYGGKTFFF
jgi:hypothetical protein